MAKDPKNNKVKKEKKEQNTFFRDFKAELKKVTWPTPKQLAIKTTVVIILVLLISGIVFLLDIGFEKGYEVITTKTSNIIKKEEKTNTPSNVIEVKTNTVNTEVETEPDVQIEPVNVVDTTTTGETAE